jgi:hypothetical protein
MKRLFPVWIGLFLLIAAGCVNEAGAGAEYRSDEQMTSEILAEQAERKYAEYLKTNDGDRAAATKKTAAYLRGFPGIKEVRVSGSDNLFVIMGDGNELLLMLGKDRL